MAAIRLLALSATAIWLMQSPAMAGDRVGPAKAQAKLVASGALDGGLYRAAIVIDLAPEAITYWRNPGESGVPPVFAFSGSDNLAQADVAMPAPTRFNEAGGDVFGYSGQVAFPVAITPADAAKPVRVTLRMDYAACEKICIPMHAEARLELAPDGKAGPDAPLVAAAVAAIPRRMTAADAAAVTPVAGADKPTWRIAPRTVVATDLFAEAPDGYFFETRRAPAGGGFLLTMAERPKDAGPPPRPVRLTLSAPGGAIEFDVRLDGAARAP